MKNIVTLVMLFLTFIVLGQTGNTLFSYEDYKIVELNQKFQLFKNGYLLVEQSNDFEFSLRINKEKNLLFLNKECLNCSMEKLIYDNWDLDAENNVLLEVIPINDSLRIINNFRFSNSNENEPLKSKTYPYEDSIIDNMVLYPCFDFGFSKSCIKSNIGKGTIEINPAFKYYKFCDLIIGKEYKFDRRGSIKSIILNFHKFINGKYISMRKREFIYNNPPEHFPFLDIEEVSEEISAVKYLNKNSFGIQTGEKWLLCSYPQNGFQEQDIIIDTNALDSIQSIPFFSPAFIAYYSDSSVLQITDDRINGKVKFDTLNISNYFAEGIDPYINKEIIVFSIAEDKHIIITHSNGYVNSGEFKIYEGIDPTNFFDLRECKLESIPRNTMNIKTCHFNK